MYSYPLEIHNDPDGLWLSAPDVARMYGVGDTMEQAMASALDGIETAFSLYVEEGAPIPLPSAPAEGQAVLHLPALVAAKVALWNAFLKSGLSKSEFARRMGVARVQVDRMIDFLHHSKIEHLERGLSILGQRIELSIRAA
ncbi:type II toxin-antitoxin system HicB family antitoxin [Pseudomonas sp. UMAB-40]|uniref:type II toxin-antitoxin system HicB family antitoxin n=1 Tax=Pseudomonas sp. UMAB-40 TaxID=1365407 RepID=UPI001C575162|nr:type II toxin-antitoxin system HicB family antitoxin [Pseudomonas sp. UMAB-40]